MRKYLVNYRVDISATIPYLEYTAIYEVESMMTQEDVEEAKTKEHGNTATMVSFCELKYSTPTLENYIVALPYFTFKNGKLETTDNDWAYIPTLYKFEGTWAIDWIDAEESDSIEVIKGATPFLAYEKRNKKGSNSRLGR
jgi:hypothetical protein